eukprot:CAMPEP_0171107716 /NCGR_PEP_ID=MMETSP0766_2-20121228/67423_1 /TAXON_ID=439317 /ORGANISM="Gambierdiscus australes, Strain CAWD 149" /LENGTH=50 /DNA_ID=CAMNT_0011569095 /DNA_START=451 /DNA_END=599 /DNA_ORIENTATION=+
MPFPSPSSSVQQESIRQTPPECASGAQVDPMGPAASGNALCLGGLGPGSA